MRVKQAFKGPGPRYEEKIDRPKNPVLLFNLAPLRALIYEDSSTIHG
jgi:hypothetical protein